MSIQVLGLGNIRLFELESWLHKVKRNDLNLYVDIAGDHRHTDDFELCKENLDVHKVLV